MKVNVEQVLNSLSCAWELQSSYLKTTCLTSDITISMDRIFHDIVYLRIDTGSHD